MGRPAVADLFIDEADLLSVADPPPDAKGDSSAEGAADLRTTFLWVILSPGRVPLLFILGLPLIELRLGLLLSSSCDMTLSRDVALDTALDLDLVDPPESLSNTPPPATVLEGAALVVFSPAALLAPPDAAALDLADPVLFGVVFSHAVCVIFL